MRALGVIDAAAGGEAAECARRFDWREFDARAVNLLQHYLRIATPNDPAALSAADAETRPWLAGREAEAAAFLAGELKADGIGAELLEAAPGRVNLVARLGAPQPARAITLLSHSDVVPAIRADWCCEPFGGEIRDDFIYGRGALDLKGLGIVHLLTLVALKRMRAPLTRDVVLLVVADEETGGHYGADWLLRTRPDLLATDLVLGEGAYAVDGLPPSGKSVHAVAVAEKGYLELELVAESDAGHASMPAADNAPARLLGALAGVLALKLPIRLTPLTRALLGNLAGTTHGLHRQLLQNPRLMTWLGRDALTRSAMVNAMIRDTVAVTVLRAGGKHNVVPAEARAVVGVRLLPETDADVLADRIGRIAADHGVTVRRLMQKTGLASRFDTWSYRIIDRHLRDAHHSAVVTPILSPAASDCRFFRARGVPAYGWIPFVIPADDLHRIHGHDERVSVTALQQGLRSFAGAVLALASAPVAHGDCA